jgi:hypothetical protein
MTLLATPSRRLLLMLGLALAACATFAGSALAHTISVSDAEHAMSQEWASYSCADRSRVQQVSSPVAQGSHAYKLEVRDGDNSYGERCEIGMGNPSRSGFPLFHEGDDRWISFQVYLPDNYPIDTPDWNIFFQIHQQGDGGCPPISLGVDHGQFKLYKSTSAHYVLDTSEMWSAPAQRNRWVKFTMHIRNSTSDQNGFVELYGDLDGQGEKVLLQQTATHTMTIASGGGAMTNHARVGIYRNPAIRGTADIYFDGFTIATDKASAEATAFAGTSVPSTAPGAGNQASAKPRSKVWLRRNGAAVHASGSNWPRIVRVYGGVRPGRSGARRSVMIQVRMNGRWEWLARSWVHRNGRFYVAANIDPSVTGRRVTLRAVVAGVGHSKPLAARV